MLNFFVERSDIPLQCAPPRKRDTETVCVTCTKTVVREIGRHTKQWLRSAYGVTIELA